MKIWIKMVAIISVVALLMSSVPLSVWAVDTTLTAETIATDTTQSITDIQDITQAAIIGEAEHLREADTKHFMLADGSMIAVSYPVVVHEKVDGKWVDIDNTLTSVVDGDGDDVARTTSQNIRFSFVNGNGNGRLMKIEDTRSNAQVIFELENAQKKNPVMDEPVTDSDEPFVLDNLIQKGTYTDILPDTDIEYIIAGTSLKENIIVHSAEAAGTVSFVLRCKNVTATLREDNSVEFTDQSGNLIFSVPAPYMYDAAGAYSDDVDVTLTTHQKGYLYTMIPDETWTQSTDRVYPVTIDPMVESSQESDDFQSAFVKESNPDEMVGGETFFWVGSNRSYYTNYGLLRFTLPTLRASDYVVATYMNLYSSLASTGIVDQNNWRAWNSYYLNGSMVMEVHEITEDWAENTVTWNTMPTFDSSIMEEVVLTADQAPNITGTSYTPGLTQLNISEIGCSWYNEGAANYGLLLKLNSKGSHAFCAEFFSNHGEWHSGTQQIHPQIFVQYRSKAGLEDAFSYTSATAGAAGTAYAQLNSGNIAFVHDDLALDGGGMPVSVSHVYNVCNSDQNIGFGYGWTVNYAQTLQQETIVHDDDDERTYMVYTDADATEHYFDVTESATEYEDQSGLELKLNEDKNTITDKEDNEWVFDNNGRLSALKNAYGDSITVAYNTNGKISTVTDGLGRDYTFTYTNGMLEYILSPDNRKMGFNYDTAGNLIRIDGSENNSIYEHNTYTYNNHVLLTATAQTGDKLTLTYGGSGTGSRVNNLTVSVVGDDNGVRARGKTAVTYGTHETTLTDEKGRTVTYQFNNYGNTRCIYNSEGQAQYFRYYAPNEENANGDSTYGPNKLEAASQTHFAVGNRLLDHGFEATTYWNGDVTTDTVCYEGTNSLKLANTAASDTKAVYQAVKLPANTAFTVSAYVKSDDLPVTITVTKEDDGTALTSVVASPTGKWQRVQSTFTVPAKNTVRVTIKAEGIGTAYVDGVQLEQGETANRYNLLLNGDFAHYPTTDNKIPHNWTVSTDGVAGVVATSVAPTALNLSVHNYTTYHSQLANASSTAVSVTTRLSQSVAINNTKKGTTLSYGAWMKADSLPDAIGENTEDTRRFGITIELYDADGALVKTQFTPANRACEEWQFVGDVIVAPKAFASAKIVLEYVDNANRAYFDGVFLYRDYFGQSFAYDDDGNVISTTAYDEQKSTFEYDGNDDLTSTISPAGAEYAYTYNDYHDVKTGTSAEGVTYAYQYDEDVNSNDVGLVQSAQTVLGSAMDTVSVDTAYDTDKNPTSQTITDARGKSVTYTYNPDGTVATATDAAGITTTYTYDTRGRTTAVTAKSADGTTLSTVQYTYDTADRLVKIQNGSVCYFFTYQKSGRLLSIAVGTSASNAVTLSTNSYFATENGVYGDEVQTMTYGNGDFKTYTYDDQDRIVGVRFEGDTADRFTYTYDKEGCLTSQTDTDTGVTITYQYDLSKRLSRIESSEGYTLTYEYDAGNALVAVKETGFGLDGETRYAYNKDDLVTRAASPTGSSVHYDYSYDRQNNLYNRTEPQNDYDTTYGFSTDIDNVTVEAADAQECPVMNAEAVRITRNGSTADVSNGGCFRFVRLTGGHRYELSFWYQASTDALGKLDVSLVKHGGAVLTAVVKDIIADGEWHYVTFLLATSAPLYSGNDDFVSPTVKWTGATNGSGTLTLNGWTFADEMETIFLPGDINTASQTATVADGASDTAATDTEATDTEATDTEATDTEATDTAVPNPNAFLRRWVKTDGSAQWIGYGGKAFLTSTPQAGEVWEFKFSAKFVSGERGDGIRVRFRKYTESGGSFEGDASTAVTLPLANDTHWHTYTAYVTINDDAYTHNEEITPYFGWGNSTGAGELLIGDVTVRKVGNQWNNAADNLGFAATTSNTLLLEEVPSDDSPIAYQKTLKLAHTGSQYSWTVQVPRTSFPQPTASSRWTLSFWAKTEGNSASSLTYVNDGSSIPRSVSFNTDGEWRLITVALSSADLSNMSTMYFSVYAQSALYLNGISLVAGDVVYANESGQNSAALKNITINTGETKFNTAIEYDTDAANTSYSRVKHYINNGKAYSYSYDTAGNISKIQSPDGSWVIYEYDSLNQLTAEHYSSCLSLSGVTEGVSYDTVAYSYDTRGNILSKTYSLDGTVVDTVTYSYADTVWQDRLTSFDGTAITYDTIGNPLNWRGGATLTWQHGRQLAGYTNAANTITYTYNSDGIRTSKTVGSITTTYTNVDGSLRLMTDGTNTLQFLNSSVLFNGTEYWYVKNAQNDVVGLIDENGTYVVEYTYDAYGNPLSKSGSLADTLGTLNPYRYRGYIYDEETGLYYCQSRYYDSVVGRFINADAFVSTGQGVIGHNMYAYCNNNVVNLTDHIGASPCQCALRPDIKICLFCGRNRISETNNTARGLPDSQSTLDEEIVFREYTLTDTLDLLVAEAEFSVIVLDYQGEWIMATPTYDAKIIDDGLDIVPSYQYEIEITDSKAYIEDGAVYLKVEYDVNPIQELEVAFLNIGIPSLSSWQGEGTIVWR